MAEIIVQTCIPSQNYSRTQVLRPPGFVADQPNNMTPGTAHIDPVEEGFSVSVVIPLYNKDRFIRRTLESVLNQSSPAAEVIIVDDGSTDDGPTRIADLVHGSVRMVKQPNAGPGAARNRGIAEATQPWVAFLDADDIWLPDHLSTLAAAHLAFPDAAVVAASYRRGTFGDSLPRRLDYTALAPRLFDLFGSSPSDSPLWTSALAARRSVLQALGGFGAFWPGEDVELWVRLALASDIALADRVTAIYLQATGGLMEQWGKSGAVASTLEPLLETLDAALANNRYLHRHPPIASYRDAWLGLFVRQSLYQGDPGAARAYIRRMRGQARKAVGPIRWLSLMPATLVRSLVKLRSNFPGLVKATDLSPRKRIT